MGTSIDRISTIIKRSFETNETHRRVEVFLKRPRQIIHEQKKLDYNVVNEESDILRVYRAKF